MDHRSWRVMRWSKSLPLWRPRGSVFQDPDHPLEVRMQNELGEEDIP